MRKRVFFALLVPFVLTGVALAASRLEAVKPGEYDPAKTYLVQAAWLNGIGCPTAASTAAYPDTKPNGTYSDPACGTGDPKDKRNEGLLLVKTGPTTNNAAAIAELKGVKGTVLTELGYDVRKPGTELAAGVRGSHCGAGAPRFNVETEDGGFFFIGCDSPAANVQMAGAGWVRLRWGDATSAGLWAYTPAGVLTDIRGMTATRITIVFDEGQDAGPDNFGAAILDNIDVNGDLVGRGATDAD